MGKSKSEVPETPNYTATAQQQQGTNMNAWQDALIANRPTQTNQYGSQTWTQDPNTGQWMQTNTLNDGQQAIFDRQQHNQNILAGVQGGGINDYDARQVDLSPAAKMPGVSDYSSLGSIPGVSDYSSLGSIPGVSDYSSLGAIPGVSDYSSLGSIPGVSDYSSVSAAPSVSDYSKLGNMPQIGQYNQQATDLYNQLAQPGLDRQRSAKEAQMAAMGLSLGSGRAWNNEQNTLNDSEDRSGMMGAQAGIQQGNTMFGQGMDIYKQGVQNMNTQFNQGMGLRQQGVSELNNQFNQGMQGRQQGVSELNNQFNQGMQGRQQGVSELNNQFTQGMQGRQQGVSELNNQFTQGMQGRQQGVSELNNQFTQGMGLHTTGTGDILNQKAANISQLQGLMGLGQQVGAPSYNGFSPTGAYQVPDQMAAQQAGYNANLQGASARNADSANNQKSAMQGIGTAASVAAAFGF
jgi:hypothetical protein